MFRRFAILLLTAATMFAANDRLYLKDGTFQMVREYEVKGDRVRYYSTERSDWEEIPLELVDLDRSRKELSDRKTENEADAKAEAEERAAEKTARKQVAEIPSDPGVTYISDIDANNAKLEALKKAEPKVVSNTKRTILKVLSPIPIVPGKSTIELDGLHSERKIANSRPEFYFRLSDYERFEIIKLTPKKDSRVAENLRILVLQGERMVEEQIDPVPSFKKQEADYLFRIWPEKPLEPGEYALIQFTEGKMSPQLWDFSVVQK